MPKKCARILIVEDMPTLSETYAAYLRADGHVIDTALSGRAALSILDVHIPDIIILDVNLPDMNGLEILRHVRQRNIAVEVLIITGQASVNLAIEAMKGGAADFVMKPLSADRLRMSVKEATGRCVSNEEDINTKAETSEISVNILGRSAAMQSVYRVIECVAAAPNANVFITGESGTGKELCADAVHRLSKLRSGPFVALNCSAIPRDLLESEIFGHVKGAFTGATSDRKGAALLADRGTLFLDEICEMDISLQAKLLRFLQTKSVQRLGEDKPQPTDVRIICATNRDPLAEVAAGRFREDLYYRLYVVPLELPPLRKRGDDVLLIARQFLAEYSHEAGKSFQGLSSEVERIFLDYRWPGNIRQLQNVIRNIVVLAQGPWVEKHMLPPELQGPLIMAPETTPEFHLSVLDVHDHDILPLEDVIQRTIEAAIRRNDGSIPRAAATLRVSPSTIYRRLQSRKDETIVAA